MGKRDDLEFGESEKETSLLLETSPSSPVLHSSCRESCLASPPTSGPTAHGENWPCVCHGGSRRSSRLGIRHQKGASTRAPVCWPPAPGVAQNLFAFDLISGNIPVWWGRG